MSLKAFAEILGTKLHPRFSIGISCVPRVSLNFEIQLRAEHVDPES